MVFADVQPPIALVCPDKRLLQNSEDDFIRTFVDEDTAKHISLIFDRHFTSFGEALDFLRPLDTPEKVAEAAINPQYLLFDTDWSDSIPDQIARAMGEYGEATEMMSHGNPGLFVAHSIFGRMYQANDLIDRSRSLRGTPLIDAPTSWQYLNWKLAKDNRFTTGASPDDTVTLHVVHALQYAAERRLCWLGNVPMDTLISIRREGAAEEVRAILSKGVMDLAETDPEDFLGSTAQVIKNIDEAFERHNAMLRELRDGKLKIFGLDVLSCLAVGSIAVSAAVKANPLLGAVAGLSGIVGASNVKDIVKKIREIRSQEREVAASPTGLFFNHMR